MILEASKDNTIFSDNNSASNGSGTALFAGRVQQVNRSRRALLAFPVGPPDIPEGATIDSVTLTLRVNQSRASATDFSLHKLTSDWGEGASTAGGIGQSLGQGGQAQTGDATWNRTFFNTQSWNSVGGDFVAVLSATASVGDPNTTSSWMSARMAADVQDWLDNPGTNFGWILIGPENSQSIKWFDSREASNMNNRPMLLVEFTPSGFVDPFEGVDLGGGFFFSSWYGIYNPQFFPWVFHIEHGWQFVFVVQVGEVFLYDLICDQFWWTTSAFNPLTIFSFELGQFIFYFQGTSNPRDFVNLETEEFFTKQGPDS